MLQKAYRFHGRGGVPHVMRRGKRQKGRQISIVYILPQGHRRQTRIAVVVSKKVSKSAPIRNRLRRQIYAHMRGLLDIVPAGTDLVVVVKPPIISGHDIPSEINKLLAGLSRPMRDG